MIKEQWLNYFENSFLPAIHSYKNFVSHTFKIAGKNIRVHYSSPYLSTSLSVAISHHQVAATPKSDLDIFVFQRGDITPKYSFNEKECTGHSKLQWHLQGDSTISNIFSPETSKGYCMIANDQPLKYWSIASPFRRILDWYLSSSKIHLVHGAVVGVNDTAVLITGPSGAGKSTIAMHCAVQGLTYLSDDYVALAENATAYGTYCSLKVLRNNPYIVANFGRELPTTGEKRVFILDSEQQPQLRSSASIKAILIPNNGGSGRPFLQALGGTCHPQQDRILSPFALKQASWLDKKVSTSLTSIVTTLPKYNLNCGIRPEEIPEVIADFCHSSSL